MGQNQGLFRGINTLGEIKSCLYGLKKCQDKMTYTHTSWFSAEAIEKARQEGRITRMCKYCGNDNPRKMDCPNCDIGFADYIYHEEFKMLEDNYEKDESISPCKNCKWRLYSDKCATCKHRMWKVKLGKIMRYRSKNG